MLKKKKKVVAFLPVKGTSERLYCKNTRIICGKPLFLHTLEKLLKCDFIDEVWLDSEDDFILNNYDYLPYKKMKRHPSLATNATDGNALFMNEVNQVEADIYIQIAATAPLLTIDSIAKAVRTLTSNAPKIDSVVCAKRDRLYTWTGDKPDYDIGNIPNSRDLPQTVSEAMSLYVITKEAAKQTQRRIGESPFLLYVDKIETIDIDYEEDFLLAEAAMTKKIVNEKLYFDKIKQLITSELLSDIMDDLKIPNRVFKLNCNLPRTRVMGRAKTLRLKKVNENARVKPNYEDIYDTMLYYEYINLNNIICVENEAKEYAYFGEMNALMSIARGAAATVVDGVTRDLADVTAMNYPVFYENNRCQDVKTRAVLDYYDKPIFIQGVEVYPDDLMFIDNDGGVVLPKGREQEILDKALENYLKEKQIAVDIAKSIDVTNRQF